MDQDQDRDLFGDDDGDMYAGIDAGDVKDEEYNLAGPIDQGAYDANGMQQYSEQAFDRSGSLQYQQEEVPAAGGKWQAAFAEVARICGFSNFTGRESDVSAVIQVVQNLKTSEAELKESHKSLQQAHAALQAQAATKALENIELQRELQAQWAAGEPAVLQLKQLLLDPAVNREFTRLSSELEEARSQLRQAQEELRAVTFTAESKTGRMLMAKCRSLQEENAEMGRELQEGDKHQGEMKLQQQRQHIEELLGCLAELEERYSLLDEENGELQDQLFATKRQVRDLNDQLNSGPPMRPGPAFEPRPFRDFGPPMGGRGMMGRGMKRGGFDRFGDRGFNPRGRF